MLDQIFTSAVDTAESKAVWFGAAGASVGAAVAVQQQFSLLPTIASVLGGHYLGHTLYSAINPPSSW